MLVALLALLSTGIFAAHILDAFRTGSAWCEAGSASRHSWALRPDGQPNSEAEKN
jgi:hypothetical protein